MLDGKRYFGSFPDETPQASAKREEDREGEIKARMLTPGLLAALEELNRELRSFLNETSDDQRA